MISRLSTVSSGAINRLDCAITAFGCVMMELDDDAERKDATEIAAIKWFSEAFREEAENIRGHTKLLNEVLNGKVAGPSPKPG
jgi:hypothetical protein